MIAVEIQTVRRRMIEHAVQNHLDAAPVRFSYQIGERRVSAQGGIDMQIVVSIVAMIGPGLEYRVHVDGVKPERLNIVELVLHANEIAVVKLSEIVVTGRATVTRIAHLRVPRVVVNDSAGIGSVKTRAASR